MPIDHLEKKIWAGDPVSNNDLASAVKELYDLDVATLAQTKETNGRVTVLEGDMGKIKKSWLFSIIDLPHKLKAFLLFVGFAPLMVVGVWAYNELSTTYKNHQTITEAATTIQQVKDATDKLKTAYDDQAEIVKTNQQEILRLMNAESVKQDRADRKSGP